IVYTTAASLQDAEFLINKVMENKLAACVNVIESDRSYYIWEGNLQSEVEVYIIFKTMCEKSAELSALILREHTYKTPALLMWNVTASNDFHKYVTDAILK
ncbi:Divalent-cation tolerance protein CutA, partial [Trachymyrmex cornetzi]